MTLRTKRSVRRAFLSFAAAFALLTLPGWAATINVPSTATPTIQSGINAASNGDTVLVAPGTYFENIDFKGKAIIVQSAGFSEGTFNGPGGIQLGGRPDTIIDGGNNGPVVTFAGGEGPDSRLNGFTIQHGGGSRGISVNNGSNRVTAGILVLNAAPFLMSNTITLNNCYGVLIENGSPQMGDNIISHTDGTAGQQCDYVAIGTGVLVDGEYDQQTTVAHGPTTLGDNLIEDNTGETEDASSSGGGGIHILHGYTYLAYNTIRNNFSQQPGGGIAVSHYNPSFDTVYIRNNIIYGNSSACGGGGIAFNENTAFGIDAPAYFIYNNTIVDNIDTNNCADILHPNGSQVYLWQDSNRFVFANNIIAGGSDTFSAVYCETLREYDPQYHLALFDHNDLFNPQGAVVSGQCLDPTGDTYGNLSADPLFKDRVNNDYHLTAGSPAIDTGNNSAVVFPDFDLDNKPRQSDATGVGYPIVDMGVYEFPGAPDTGPTEATITPSTYVANVGDSVTFNVGFTSPSGTPTGQVFVYQDDKLFVGTELDPSGNANPGGTELVPGVHAIVAKYAGANGIPPAATIKLFVVVNGGNPSTMTLTSSLNPSTIGQSVTFTATLTASSGVPTGTVTFTDGTTPLGTQPVAGGIATYATSTLAAGTHHILATYTPDSTSYLSSSATQTQVVTGTAYASNILLSSDPNPSPIGYRATFFIKSASADTSYIPSPIVLTDTTTNTILRSLLPDSSGNATYSTTDLAAGVHHITATYAGDATHAAEQVSIDQDVTGTTAFATTTTVTSSLNPADAGQSVTFTATVISPAGVPLGFVAFIDEPAGTLGYATLVNGVASFTTSTLAPGTHPILAGYVPDPADLPYKGSNATLSQVINGIPTTTKLTVIPTTAAFGTTISMYGQVLASRTPVTSGTITYMDGTTPLTTITLAPNLVPNFNISTLAVGTHMITAVYSGDATHNASTSTPVTVTITGVPAALSLTSSRNPAFALQPFTLTAALSSAATAIPTGTINFFVNGAPVGSAATNPQGIATLNLSLSTGTYALTASFTGSGNFGAAASAPITETVVANSTGTVLTAAPNPGFQGGNETLTATVATQSTTGSAAASPVPTTGTVTFFDSGAPIATSAIDTTGHATFSTSALAVGDHIVTATFNGSANFLASTSQAYTLAILLRDFTLSTDQSLTIQTEHHKDLSLTLASLGDFSDVVALSCGPMPADASCTFSNNEPLLPAGSTLPTTLRIDTDAIYDYLASASDNSREPPHGHLSGVISCALLLPITLFTAIRRRRTVHGRIKLFASLLVFLITMTFAGCSGHYPGHTPPGSYSITITGQGATTHISHTATVTLMVTE